MDRAFERNLFLGSDRTSGRSLVSPQLQEWIAGKLRDEAAILKERWKGREERQLARGSLDPAPPTGTPAVPKGGGNKK